MAQIGPPLQWPLIWFALTFVVMVNPFRVSHSDISRKDLMSNTSGYSEIHVGPRSLVDNQAHS
jgi:hypothetical protein